MIRRVLRLLSTVALLAMAIVPASPCHAEPTDLNRIELSDTPQGPGTHEVSFQYELDGKSRTMKFLLRIPDKAEADEKLPMIVFLCGAGERGMRKQVMYNNGPIAEFARHKPLDESVDAIVLAPMCPTDQRWDQGQMPTFVADCVRLVTKHWPVDADRVYLTGLSMGGKGTWHAANAAPELYAAIVPFAADEVEAEATAKRLAGKMAVWVVVGAHDSEGYVRGSRRMAEALADRDADVTLTEIDRAGHGVWAAYYNKQQFYDWLLLHRKHKPLPADQRPGAESMRRMAYLPPPDPRRARFERRLVKHFAEFAPHWQISNSAWRDVVGLHPLMFGKQNVFVTHPLNSRVPCRLMITRQVDAEKPAKLRFDVGHRAGQVWKLTVRINHDAVVERIVDDKTAEKLWLPIEIDLKRWAGKQAFIELSNEAVKGTPSHGLWHNLRFEPE